MKQSEFVGAKVVVHKRGIPRNREKDLRKKKKQQMRKCEDVKICTIDGVRCTIGERRFNWRNLHTSNIVHLTSYFEHQTWNFKL